MKYIDTPLSYDPAPLIVRDLQTEIQRLDNLVELIVFTPRGAFNADPDFGFENWNHEYSSISLRDYNNNQSARNTGSIAELRNEMSRRESQESICRTLAIYEPMLKQVEVSIELNNAAKSRISSRRKMQSKYEVSVIVSGVLDSGLGTSTPYRKVVTFLMEPTLRSRT